MVGLCFALSQRGRAKNTKRQRGDAGGNLDARFEFCETGLTSVVVVAMYVAVPTATTLL